MILPGGVKSAGAVEGAGGGGRLDPNDSDGNEASKMERCVLEKARMSSAYLRYQ